MKQLKINKSTNELNYITIINNNNIFYIKYIKNNNQ